MIIHAALVQELINHTLYKGLGKHASLKVLSRNARESDVRRSLEEAKLARSPGDLQNIDAVLQVSVSVNRKLYEEVRNDETMCRALRNLMKNEIAE